ncbi:MAG: serine/threonine protein kinase [bacterium]|nr:serine/threonine protein kinase [bacterium]
MEDFPEIPGYKIQRLLGQGRLTNVYLGIKEDIDEKVVIKVLQAELMSEQKFGKRFLYEAVKAAKLEHPNIAKILDMGETGNHFYFAIEYFKESLKESITQKHTDPDANVDNDDDVLQVHSTADIDVDAVLSVFKQLAGALDYAHKAGAVHQDIRPGNIFFKEDDTPVLVDFFMAPLVPKSSTLKIKGAHLCIPQYASPEQALRRPPEPTSDIYSLGIVLYEMLTGTVPYNAEETIAIENQHVMEPIPKLEEEVSIFQPLLEKMMCKKLEERAQSGFEVVQFIDILKDSPEELRQETSKKEGEDFKLELDFTGTPGTKSSWQDNMPPLPEQSQTDFISESPREQTEFELDDHNAGGFQVEYGASDAVNDIPVPAPPEKDYLQPDLLQTPPKTDDSEESLDDLIVPGGGRKMKTTKPSRITRMMRLQEN